MKPEELVTRIGITVVVAAAALGPLYARFATPLLHASLPENGGWEPAVLRIGVGEPLHLRMTSDDVIHGFAVGQVDMEPVDIVPGQVTEATVTFEAPGSYTFFCTRWCGLNHWRMRGTIEVYGPDDTPRMAAAPLFVTHAIDIDAPHNAPVIPAGLPSASRGRLAAAGQSIDFSTDYYRLHSPYQVFEALRNPAWTPSDRWDIVAYVWETQTSEASLSSGARLYRENCAACHGENAAGDGVFADDLAMAGEGSLPAMAGQHSMRMQAPSDLIDPGRMLGASPALLEGKVLRGGMGTGMPMWGAIFTEQQRWDLVAYLYSLQFEYDVEEER